MNSNTPINTHYSRHGAVTALDIQQARIKRRMAFLLSTEYISWGYNPIVVPLIDEYNAYKKPLAEWDIYGDNQFIDRDGQRLLIRPDITLFLARAVAHSLHHSHLPVRLSYDGQIARNTPHFDSDTQEQFHSGVELIGATGIDGECEITMCALESISRLNLHTAEMRIGSRRLFDLFAGATDDIKDNNHTAELEQAVRCHDKVTINDLWKSRGYTDKQSRALGRLFTYSGADIKSIRDMIHLLPHAAQADDELNHISSILTTIQTLSSHACSFDGGEIGDHPYYTGIAFSIYTPDANRRVAGGGRYDKLFATFGYDAPSIGFTVYVDRIVQYSQFASPSTDDIVAATGKNFIERYHDAQTRRASGMRAHI